MERKHYLELVGGNLHEFRRQAGLTQKEAESRLHISALYRYENGQREMGIWLLYRLHDFYRVPMAAILGEDSDSVFPVHLCKERRELTSRIQALVSGGGELDYCSSRYWYQIYPASLLHMMIAVSYPDGRYRSERKLHSTVFFHMSVEEIRELLDELASDADTVYRKGRGGGDEE